MYIKLAGLKLGQYPSLCACVSNLEMEQTIIQRNLQFRFCNSKLLIRSYRSNTRARILLSAKAILFLWWPFWPFKKIYLVLNQACSGFSQVCTSSDKTAWASFGPQKSHLGFFQVCLEVTQVPQILVGYIRSKHHLGLITIGYDMQMIISTL